MAAESEYDIDAGKGSGLLLLAALHNAALGGEQSAISKYFGTDYFRARHHIHRTWPVHGDRTLHESFHILESLRPPAGVIRSRGRGGRYAAREALSPDFLLDGRDLRPFAVRHRRLCRRSNGGGKWSEGQHEVARVAHAPWRHPSYDGRSSSPRQCCSWTSTDACRCSSNASWPGTATRS